MSFHLREQLPAAIKPPPKTSAISVPFTYAPSADGTDENILVFLHGLGDTHVPFAKLGRQLKLPQTAVLSLRAPEQVPFLYEQAFQWYPSFNQLGELIDRPDPSSVLDLTYKIINHLTTDCLWSAQSIHLFGFAQGGSVAVELGVKWWLSQVEKQDKSDEDPDQPLGSIVSISGPMLSYPTFSKICPTPLLVFHRPPPSESALPSGALVAFKKGFENVTEVKMSGGDGMPRSKDDWEPIMKFWSEHLTRRQAEGLYEVISDT